MCILTSSVSGLLFSTPSPALLFVSFSDGHSDLGESSHLLISSCVQLLSHVLLFAATWTVAHQAPLSMEEYWSGVPFPTPEDLPSPRIELVSRTSPVFSGGFFTIVATWEAHL